MKLGLEYIGKIAGVSKSTVSRVINNHPNVSRDTRERVLEVIRVSNYRPNKAAQALVTQQTRVLSVFTPQAAASTFTDLYFPALIQSIILAANQHNFAIMLWLGNSVEEEERYCERILNHGLFDGVIVASVVDNDPLVARLLQSVMPYILIGPPLHGAAFFADVDNCSGAKEAVEHLLRFGYKQIGTITGPISMGAARNRLQGYLDALTQAGIPIDERLIAAGNFDKASGYDAMTLLIKRGVDAVFCASDMMALGAMNAAHAVGWRIPEDVALVGFDDMLFAETLRPPLTTVHQHINELGMKATELLIRLIEGEPLQVTQVMLTAHLIVRSSCGAAKIA